MNIPLQDDDYARSILRPDNYELFDIVRGRLNARPSEPIDCIAGDIGVSVDQLCRWVVRFSEKKRPKYQSPKFAALRPPAVSPPDLWADEETRRRQRFAQKARDGARATRLALAEADQAGAQMASLERMR